ncbi:hypothetical protein [Nocardioides sp. 616]|uniref:hypothetical protein n=1 Tax=Nocardioides sp. 616 TaxID=2268090 RepID=UPI0013B3BFAA|nr:hypothetical protein [Nocardioides sp. 616]
MTDHPSLVLLREANPVPSPPSETRDAAEAEMLLARIRAESVHAVPPPRCARQRRRVVLGTALATSVLVLTALPGSQVLSWLLPDDGSAVAATPDLLSLEHSPRQAGTAEALIELAGRMEQLPNDIGAGSVSEVRYQAWSLSTRVDGGQAHSEVVPEEVTTVLDLDGAGTVTTRRTDNGESYETALPAGETRLDPLPSSLPQMRERLGTGDRSDPARRFTAVADVLKKRPAGPASRAAILRYLAATPGVGSVGDVRDRLNRAGWGIAVESAASGLPTRHLLVLDPATGAVIGYEQMLTRDAGKLNVTIPSVISYVAWSRAAFHADD